MIGRKAITVAQEPFRMHAGLSHHQWMRSPDRIITCSVQDALSPALVPEPLKLAHNILHHRDTACCTIQKPFDLHTEL